MRLKTVAILIFIAVLLGAIVVVALLNNAALKEVPGEPQTTLQRAGRVFKTLADTKDPKELLLPDMIVTEPRELYVSTSENTRTIRFSTTFINQGSGPLEVLGHSDDELGLTYATQYIREKGGPGVYREIGEFAFHEGHSHWHVADYVFYQLIPAASPDQAPVTQTQKMSFCIWDEDHERPEMDGSPTSLTYPFVCNRLVQGMSVGWSDTYDASFEGQEMDITNIPDGRYIFRSIVNPDGKISELNTQNNTSEIVIEIAGNSLVVVQ